MQVCGGERIACWGCSRHFLSCFRYQLFCVLDAVNIYHLSLIAMPELEVPDVSSEPPLLARVPANIVQSIRAFRVQELQEEAQRLGQHFLYAYCAEAATKPQVVATIAQSFHFPQQVCKTAEELSACLTKQVFLSGPQSGFVVVLEQLPNTPRFDRDARETVLDVFRDAADFWAGKKVPFRVFYSFK